MKKIKKILLSLTIIIIIYNLIVVFMGIKSTNWAKYDRKNSPETSHIGFSDAINIINVFMADKIQEDTFLAYEDKNNLYFTNKKTSWLAYSAIYAKIKGVRIRKKDGYFYLHGINTWLPTGWVPYSASELRELTLQWKTSREVDRHIGPGICRFYYHGYTNNVFLGIIQERKYLTTKYNPFLNKEIIVYFHEGVVLSNQNENVNIELDPIWDEGAFDVYFQ